MEESGRKWKKVEESDKEWKRVEVSGRQWKRQNVTEWATDRNREQSIDTRQFFTKYISSLINLSDAQFLEILPTRHKLICFTMITSLME